MNSATKTGKLFVISGPSGVGKSTLTAEVVKRSDAILSISATTRPRRGTERDGVDYFFVNADEFRTMIEADELLEWAEVFGNYYGTPETPVDEALAAGKIVVLEIDVQGGIQVAAKRPDAELILISAPSDVELRRRLTGRATDEAKVIERRLAKAMSELETARESGAYIHEVVNDTLEDAISSVLKIVNSEKQQ